MVCISRKWKSGFRSLCPQIMFGLITDLIPVFLLGSLGIGKRCFGSRNNSTNSNPFAGGFLISRESSKVSFELPEGFSVTAENGSSKVCFELLETFRVTPKTLLPTAYLPKSISLFLTFDAQSSFLFVPLQDKILINGKKLWDCLLSFQGLPKDYHLTFYVQGAKRLDKFCQ